MNENVTQLNPEYIRLIKFVTTYPVRIEQAGNVWKITPNGGQRPQGLDMGQSYQTFDQAAQALAQVALTQKVAA